MWECEREWGSDEPTESYHLNLQLLSTLMSFTESFSSLFGLTALVELFFCQLLNGVENLAAKEPDISLTRQSKNRSKTEWIVDLYLQVGQNYDRKQMIMKRNILNNSDGGRIAQIFQE